MDNFQRPQSSYLLTLFKDGNFDDAMKQMDTEKAALSAWEAAIPPHEGLIFKTGYEGYHLVTKQPGGKWRITFIACDMIVSGHDVFASRLEAVKAIPDSAVRIHESELPPISAPCRYQPVTT